MLRERINEALKAAMKSKSKRAVSTSRLILAALKDRDIAARSKGNSDGIDEDEILLMLHKMVAQRRESIEMYERGDRKDLADEERTEIDVIQTFLPRQMDDAAIAAAVEAAIAAIGATGIKDMGKVMALLRNSHPGAMEFGKASAMVKSRLS
ncbi:MAG: GatB/YqeY domain-containing protein [Alphaproteobacteria bacterium]